MSLDDYKALSGKAGPLCQGVARWLARFVRDPEVYITVSFSDLRRGVAQWQACFVRDPEVYITVSFSDLRRGVAQEGWDLQIRNVEDGSLVEQIQLKASTSMSYVKTALDRYPDIRVAVPSEVDGVKSGFV